MIPMIGGAVPGVTTMALTVDPAAIGLVLVLAAGIAWLVSGTARELGRVAAERTAAPTPSSDTLRLAA
jgi:hypothetical protein